MQRVVERILNLLAFLLTVGRPVTAEEIRNTVNGYDQPSDEAFRRTFERDKDLLRRLGVPLHLEHTDAWEVEQGYVVSPDQYALPDPGLTDEERTALWLATRMVRLGGQAPGPGAIFKLGGAPIAAAGDPLTADLGAEAETLAEVFRAVTDRRTLQFEYHDEPRTMRPWGLVHRMGHWYVVGEAAKDKRTFRVDRMSAITVGTKAGAFERPKGFRASEGFPDAPWEAGEADVEVTVRFDAEVAWWARRQLSNAAHVVDAGAGAIDATFPVASPDAFIGWMIGFEDSAEILAPDDLRRRFVEHVGAPG
ncbi:MAG: WYL domain-containing protein [Actinomycetota bacterium]|jgi:predicted DNA-binding transcriptional regulator YafY|nr:WYL domain-containing protein [Actinomycetota bacterium]